ncbi:triose-phosphate isomerase [Candidatus Saccharibacteria bacterium]|nr:triose-phosphate isomerase [Candidatus Saccharibacteria bacterium]NCU40439.1 triose-phosphate isomerase [Candidatus Saccharibacteria bacterium]
MRKKLIVGNWKMYNNTQQASLLLHALSEKVKIHRDVEIVLAPSVLVLQSLSLQVNRRQFKLAAQNCYWRDEGAFTGEISAAMLQGLVEYVIVGHSERRHIFNEPERDIRQKVQAVLRSGMKPILCVGETAQQRSDNETVSVINDQLYSGLANVTSEEMPHVAISYEPIWAIGSGKTPMPKDVLMVEKAIRKQISAMFGKKAAEEVRIIYGGSVTSANAPSFLVGEGIDGFLVGGASLRPDEFADIVSQAFDDSREERK